MKKKMTAMLLVIVMLVGLFPTVVGAASYYPRYVGKSNSLVTALQTVKVDASYENRARIAEANGMKNYTGTAGENLLLLNQLKLGKLKTVDPVKTAAFLPVPNSSGPYVCTSYEECTSGGTCYEVTKDNAPLRAADHNKGTVLARLKKGQLLRVKKIRKNSKGNKWAVVEYIRADHKTAWAYMYTGNITKHTSHDYMTVLEGKNGTLKICMICGYGVASSGQQKESCDLMCVADQAVRGDYADNNPSFWGLVARVAVGEIPFAGTAADIRDLVYDATNDPNALYIGLDLLALIPIVGSLKYLSHMDNLKHADTAVTAAKVGLKAGKYSFSGDAFRHFVMGNGVKGKAVSGAHNLDYFTSTIQANGGSIVSKTPHPSVKGIYEITYKAGADKEVYKTAKTVYDPDIISDARMNEWAVEALTNAKPVKGTTDMISGSASNGLRFEAYIDSSKTITSFYPRGK